MTAKKTPAKPKPGPLVTRLTITVASTCRCDDVHLEDAELGDNIRRCLRCGQTTTIGLVRVADSLSEFDTHAQHILKELG